MAKTVIPEVPLGEFLALFDQSAHAAIRAAMNRPGVEYLVCFENQAFDSSQFGRRAAMAVGPTCTYKTVAECEGKHLHDLPSQRQYPTVCCRRPEVSL